MSNTTPNWDAKQADLVSVLPVQKLNKVADDWNVSTETPSALGIGWDPQVNAYTFPEYDGSSHIIGIVKRDSETGAKKMYFRSQRGLSYTTSWKLTEDQPILIPEGVSDTAALHNLGLNAVGRPSNTGGVEHLAELLADCSHDQEIIVLGENDEKDDGNWPGAMVRSGSHQNCKNCWGDR